MSRVPDPRELDPPPAGLIRANLTRDKFATDTILTRAVEADLDGVFLRVHGRKPGGPDSGPGVRD